MAVVWCAAARVLAAWLVGQDPVSADVEAAQPVVAAPDGDAHEIAEPKCPHANAVAPLARRAWIRHSMVPRERVDQVAARYDVALEDLRTWNGMSTSTLRLKKGTRLKLRARRTPPPRQRSEHVVAEGDDWWSIARAHGADVHDLKAYNWPHRDKMKPGARIVVWSDPVVRDWIAQDNADELDVRDGAAGVGSPDSGWLVGGVRIPEGEGYALHQPAWSYGTTHAVRELVRALAVYREAGGPLVEIGAMSKLRGGEIGDHRSHQTGRDVDVGLPRRVGLSRAIPLTNRRIDWLGVWKLLEAFAAADVDVVWLDYEQQKRVHEAALKAGVERSRVAKLLQYPMGRASRALVRHADGHDMHMHVRFRCGPCEPECVDDRGPELATPSRE